MWIQTGDGGFIDLDKISYLTIQKVAVKNDGPKFDIMALVDSQMVKIATGDDLSEARREIKKIATWAEKGIR